MEKRLNEMLAAAEANLARYTAMGNENAVRAATNMVANIRADLAAL